MQWNYNMDEAKKSIVTKQIRQTKKGSVAVEVSEPFYVVVAAPNSHLTKSYWLEDQGRWSMFTDDPEKNQPFAFIPWDEFTSHPEGVVPEKKTQTVIQER